MVIDLNLLKQCAPDIAPVTMRAIVKTESRGNPLALALNKGKQLKHAARNYEEAAAWADYLEAKHYDFDVGLAQVNIKNIHKYGYKARQLLDPCINLQVAGDILHKNYTQALNSSLNDQEALLKAISAYNTGNYQAGFGNGYVGKVIANVRFPA